MKPGLFLYRYRGWVPVPLILYALAAARPSPAGLLAGGVLMAAGEGIRLWAAAHLGKTARSSRPLAHRLVTRGPYARTRHPLYWGNLLLTTGYALMASPPPVGFPVLVALLFVLLYAGHARREEAVLGAAFPGRFALWAAAVPRWRWRLRPAGAAGAGETGRPTMRRALAVEALTLNAEWWLLVALWIRTRIG